LFTSPRNHHGIIADCFWKPAIKGLWRKREEEHRS